MKALLLRTGWVCFGVLLLASSLGAQQTVLYVSNTDPTCGGQAPCFTISFSCMKPQGFNRGRLEPDEEMAFWGFRCGNF